MERRKRRGPDDYFNKQLVELVDALFKMAAHATGPGGQYIAPRRDSNRPRPAYLRELICLMENDYSNWKYADFGKSSQDKPREVVERLIALFDGSDYDARISDPDDLKRAKALFTFWCEMSDQERTLALQGLRTQLDVLINEQTQGLVEKVRTPPSTRYRPLFRPAIDLSAPVCPDLVSRPQQVAHLGALAQQHYCVVVEGTPKSGKRYLVKDWLGGAETRPIWFSLTSESLFRDVVSRIRTLPEFPSTEAGQEVLALTRWLSETDTLLVLDGLDDRNRHSFAPFLNAIMDLAGPCRVVVTATVHIPESNRHTMQPLSAPELEDFLRGHTSLKPIEAAHLLEEIDVWPAMVRLAATHFGRVGRQELRVAASDLSREVMHKLAPSRRGVLEVLQAINLNFDASMLSEILDEIDSSAVTADVLDELQSLMIIRQLSVGTWRLEARVADFTNVILTQAKLSKILLRLADHVERDVKPGDRHPRRVTIEDAKSLYVSCRLRQIANADADYRQQLVHQFSGAMERAGFFRRLAVVYRFEVDDADTPNLWFQFKLARALCVIGRFGEAWAVLDTAFHESANDAVDDTHVTIVRQIADLLVEVGKAKFALPILDGALGSLDISDTVDTICNQLVSAISWALIKAGYPSEAISLDNEILDAQFGGLATPFARQLSDIRTGVALRDMGNAQESVVRLRSASEFFASRDVRAYAWSTLHLAISERAANDTIPARLSLSQALTVNAANGLFNGEVSSLYKIFVDDQAFAPLHVSLRAELERISSLEQARLDFARTVEGSTLLRHVMIDQGAAAEGHYVFDKGRYVLFSVASPFAMASKFNRSLVRRLQDHNEEETLDLIFAKLPPAAIFREPIYNRVIIEVCKRTPILKKKFVDPHLETIIEQGDGTLFAFARYLELCGDLGAATKLLDNVTRTSDFSYFNIKANLAARLDPDEALVLNDSALRLARTDQQKAQILNNKAGVVLQWKMQRLYQEAINWCEASLAKTRKAAFLRWPTNALLKLTILSSRFDDIDEVIEAHHRRFRVSAGILQRVLEDLPRGGHRSRAIVALGRLSQSWVSTERKGARAQPVARR